jgi:putative transposase
MNDPFPDQVDEQNWDEACRRADAIRDFLKQQPDGSTIGSIAALAAELGLSQATTSRARSRQRRMHCDG